MPSSPNTEPTVLDVLIAAAEAYQRGVAIIVTSLLLAGIDAFRRGMEGGE